MPQEKLKTDIPELQEMFDEAGTTGEMINGELHVDNFPTGDDGSRPLQKAYDFVIREHKRSEERKRQG